MMEHVWDIFQQGGPVMVPIALAGVIGLAIFLERLVNLRRDKVVPPRLIRAVNDLIRQGKISEARVLCQQDDSIISTVLLTGAQEAGKRRAHIKEMMQDVGKSAVAELERFVHGLGTIAGVSPLMGLLGTVTGMISVFQKVTAEGVGDPRLLASGIWEALLTTAFGLIVAIPAYIGYRYLLGRVDRLTLDMEEQSLRLLEHLHGEPALPGTVKTAPTPTAPLPAAKEESTEPQATPETANEA